MGTLYIVATPIGNLEDITLRALRILKEVDLVLCEDTRHARKLLDHYSIATKTLSYHQHSGAGRTSLVIRKLQEGKDLALISDAGTPCISDPGVALIKEITTFLGDDACISPIPGPSAFVAGLSISGLPSHEFLFLGFIPHKKGRETIFERIKDSTLTTVFYESTHRIVKTLERLSEMLEPRRELVVCREVTKKFESIYRGSASDILFQLSDDSEKGEFVVLVAPQ